MLQFGITNVMLFLIILGACLSFVITWIIKSESKITSYRPEVARLKARLESSEREKFMLSESAGQAVDPAPRAQTDAQLQQATEEKSALLLQALEQNSSLEDENKKLKSELAAARESLEEIYKALAEKK